MRFCSIIYQFVVKIGTRAYKELQIVLTILLPMLTTATETVKSGKVDVPIGSFMLPLLNMLIRSLKYYLQIA